MTAVPLRRSETVVPLADENTRLRAENLRLRQELDRVDALLCPPNLRVPPDWRLSRVEDALLRALYAGGSDWTYSSRLIRALQGAGGTSGSPDCIKVHVSRIRSKLPTDCGIETAPVRHNPLFGEIGWRLNVRTIAWLYVYQQEMAA